MASGYLSPIGPEEDIENLDQQLESSQETLAETSSILIPGVVNH